MTDKEVMQMALDALNRAKRDHYYCEDRFYSCPKHEEGCANDLDGDKCTCGADSVNETIDTAIKALSAELAQPEPELVTWADKADMEREGHDFWVSRQQPKVNGWPLYSGLPKRGWVGLTDEERIACEVQAKQNYSELARVIETKLKDKNGY